MTEERKGMYGRIIKWDGDAPTEPAAYENPAAHPACAEVVEIADGQPARVVYRRDEHGTD